MVTISRFSYRNSGLNCWICSKVFVVNFELIDHIGQKVSVDFDYFFVLDYLEILELSLATEQLEKLRKSFSYNQARDFSDYPCSAYPKKHLVL